MNVSDVNSMVLHNHILYYTNTIDFFVNKDYVPLHNIETISLKSNINKYIFRYRMLMGWDLTDTCEVVNQR